MYVARQHLLMYGIDANPFGRKTESKNKKEIDICLCYCSIQIILVFTARQSRGIDRSIMKIFFILIVDNNRSNIGCPLEAEKKTSRTRNEGMRIKTSYIENVVLSYINQQQNGE